MTDRGVVRATNQDNCMAACPDDDSCFAVVCDGMGGALGGDVASEIAVKTISGRIAAGWRAGMSNESLVNLLTTSITAANICVLDRAEEDPRLRGMGTTVVAAAIQQDRLVIAHVGDSRAYAFTDRLEQLTKDHSLVQDMVHHPRPGHSGAGGDRFHGALFFRSRKAAALHRRPHQLRG